MTRAGSMTPSTYRMPAQRGPAPSARTRPGSPVPDLDTVDLTERIPQTTPEQERAAGLALAAAAQGDAEQLADALRVAGLLPSAGPARPRRRRGYF